MNKIKRILSGITAFALACGLTLTASAELKTGDYKAYKGTGYMAKYEVLSVKDGKTTVKVTLKNTSKKKINNWAVGFDDCYWKVADVKYGRLLNTEYSYNTVIRDNGTNGSVAPNECVSFSFTISDNYYDLPERLKVYSDLNKSNTVDELNTAAKECFNSVAGFLADEETTGTPPEECFKNGFFANANSKNGIKTGFNYKYQAQGDRVINITASQYARGNVSVYIGRTTYNGQDVVFIQVRDNKTGKVGQYPRSTDGTAEWGAFDLTAPVYAKDFNYIELNGAAKDAYNAVAEHMADLETQGLDFKGIFENGGFPIAHTKDGLTIDFTASLTECDELVNNELISNYEGVVIYVGTNGIDDYGYPDFFVQAKDPKTGKVGQYPHPTLGEATWGTFDTNAPMPPMDQKSLNGDAKTVYNAVAVYFADLETQGNDVFECYNNGCFKYASTKEGLKIGTASLTDGDAAINTELLGNGFTGDANVYVGMTSSEDFFVQIKDNTTGNIGQYPTPDHRDLEWGTYSKAVPKMVRDQKSLNGDAKTVYNAVAVYFADLETEGYDIGECYKNGCFAKASTIEGLKIGQEAEYTDGDKAINDEMTYFDNDRYGLTVYVGMDLNSKDQYGDYAFFVQVKDSTGRVGQYPDPTKDSATWGTHPDF